MGPKKYDIIVIGGGHAGCEAASAASRMGCSTLLVTLRTDTIGLLSCNPAIGGVGKGQLVKEVDALGGQMAKAADACGIQFRILNSSKGAAVHSSRAQIDSKRYRLYMQGLMGQHENLEICRAKVTGLIVEGSVIKGIEIGAKGRIPAGAVIITPGTFLNGLIHIGMKSFAGGRLEEQETASELSDSLKCLGLRLLRFKTGTCARLDGKTIDFSNMRIQDGDHPPEAFSFSTKKLDVRQVPCYITYTDDRAHEIIRNNLDRSPLYSGKITGTGVRYCPSFEDKVVKFPHHQRHQVFLEPEGLDTDEYYPNGLSTSLPQDVQEAFIHSIPGLERVKINRFGYGIEHDVVDPTQLFPTLETKNVQNLYLAGQINGTTGYEEAAAQGIVAGINAALRVNGKPPMVLDRTTSYIGVLIDDLVTKGTNEPYRMFTSRVEYRLLIREDNADMRLRKTGFDLGLVAKKEYDETLERQRNIEHVIKLFGEKRICFNGTNAALYQILKRPEVRIEQLKEYVAQEMPSDVLKGAEIEVKYSGYIQRQLVEVKSFKNLERIKIPQGFSYKEVSGLSREIVEKLSYFKPLNLGQVGRISGVTPAAIALLMVFLKKQYAKN